jgi:pentapeptide MXKDX repeat protein
MVRTIKAGLAFTALAGAFLLQPSVHAQDNMKRDNSMKQDSMKQDSMKQDSMKQDSMKQDDMKHDKMQGDKMMHDGKAKTLETGKFHGKVHATSGRATVYQEADGKMVLRLTNFKTSNGPDVHVLLVRAEDKALDEEIVKGEVDNVELGTLKGNHGDQNYDLPASVDLNKYQAVAIYCERFHAIFGVARLEKF